MSSADHLEKYLSSSQEVLLWLCFSEWMETMEGFIVNRFRFNIQNCNILYFLEINFNIFFFFSFFLKH